MARIALGFLALSFSLAAAANAVDTADDDWRPVGKAIDDAKVLWDKDCPDNVCGSTTALVHKQRIAAYAKARDMLLSYETKRSSNASAADSLHLLYRLGLASDGMEDYVGAFRFYGNCLQRAVIGHVTFTQDGKDEPILGLCKDGVERECRLVRSECYVSPPPPNSPDSDGTPTVPKPWILGGKTAAIAPRQMSPEARGMTQEQKDTLQLELKKLSST